MIRRLLIAVVIVVLVDFSLAEPALASDCGVLTDCFPTVKAAIAAGAAAFAGAIAGFFAIGGGDLAGNDSGAETEPPAVEPADDLIDDPCAK